MIKESINLQDLPKKDIHQSEGKTPLNAKSQEERLRLEKME